MRRLVGFTSSSPRSGDTLSSVPAWSPPCPESPPCNDPRTGLSLSRGISKPESWASSLSAPRWGGRGGASAMIGCLSMKSTMEDEDAMIVDEYRCRQRDRGSLSEQVCGLNVQPKTFFVGGSWSKEGRAWRIKVSHSPYLRYVPPCRPGSRPGISTEMNKT